MIRENKVKTGSRYPFHEHRKRIKKSSSGSSAFFDAARLVCRIAREKLAKGKSERPPGDFPVVSTIPR